MNGIKRKLYIIFGAVLLILFVWLTAECLNFRRPTPSYEGRVMTVTDVTAESSTGETMEVSLPHTFSGIQKGGTLTLSMQLDIEKDDYIYVKSVYAPFTLTADGETLYSYGFKGDIPDFMADPPTAIATVPLSGHEGNTWLKLTYYAPATIDYIKASAPVVGTVPDISRHLLGYGGLPLYAAIVQLIAGTLLIIGFIPIIISERKGQFFFWLGCFCISVGLWSFGECDVTGFFIGNPVVLYIFAFTGMFMLPLPFIQFGLSIINFHRPGALKAISVCYACMVAAAMVMQLAGLVQFHVIAAVFRLVEPVILIFYSLDVLWEAVHYHETTARRFFAPITIIAVAAMGERINYSSGFTDALTIIFQSGTMIFFIYIFILCVVYFNATIKLEEENHVLMVKNRFLDHSIEHTKAYHSALLGFQEKLRLQSHDLRHQLAALYSYCENEDYAGLKGQLDELIAMTPKSSEIVACKNASVNMLISYYAPIAERYGIELKTKLDVPEVLDGIPDSSLLVVFGNLIENAIEACCRDNVREKRIDVESLRQGKTLLIKVENPSTDEITEVDGKLKSSKRDDYGIGTESVRLMAKRHGGDAVFMQSNGMFTAIVHMEMGTGTGSGAQV